MNIVFLGSGYFGIPCLEAILQTRHRLAFVVTQPPHPAGRGRKAQSHACGRMGRPSRRSRCWRPMTSTPQTRWRPLPRIRPDVILVIAFGQKIGQAPGGSPDRGAINVHASLLPRWRGAAPINWAIMAGDPVTGVSLITLAEKIDAGHVLAQEQTRHRARRDGRGPARPAGPAGCAAAGADPRPDRTAGPRCISRRTTPR